ncbi:MAG: hypothetical protein JWM96_585 [Alphaproteobacteria bacterium]|nr:hypothetical protein [Alphaproteobacteria bacterium]
MRSGSRLWQQQGFTLVELAIVLMIIGLLIGGILRGQELLMNARIASTIKQVTSYTGAINTFRDAYAALPGDLSQALNRIPGCATNGCTNGNGNGLIGAPILFWQLSDQSIPGESTQFWKHLALTHIISGVNPSANALSFGISHPSAPLGGGFSVVTSVKDPNDPTGSMTTGSIVLRLHGDLVGGPGTVIEDNPVVSPKQAAQLDRKMDDGMPGTGDVQAGASGTGARVNGGTQSDCEGPPGYKESVEFTLCTMAFLIR